MDINLIARYELLDTLSVIIGEIDRQITDAENKFRQAKTEEAAKEKENEIKKLQAHRRQQFEKYQELENELNRYLNGE